MSVGLIYSDTFLQHESPPGHPERPARLRTCVEALQTAELWAKFALSEPRAATTAELEAAHAPEYVAFIESLSGHSGYLDPDTFVSDASVIAAKRAAGGLTQLSLDVADGAHRAGLALVRPPGHHAESKRCGGFCLLSNVAVAAATLRARGLRVAIVDFDVHHGNGTQEIFYADPEVLFVSIHRYSAGFYPGSGAADETGTGAGKGQTLNIPLSPGSAIETYVQAFDQAIAPKLAAFAPDMLLVSAGFDAHRRDPIGGMRLDDSDYDQLIARIDGWAERLCHGRWVTVLEGGYDLQALSSGVTLLARRMLATR